MPITAPVALGFPEPCAVGLWSPQLVDRNAETRLSELDTVGWLP
jgi:hypothetical protein